MSLKYLRFGLCFLLLVSCYNSKISSDLEISGLKGTVKILKEYHTYYIGGYGDNFGKNKDSLVKSITKYNEKGNMIEWLKYNENNQVYNKWVFSYDKDHKKVMIDMYNGSNNLIEKTILKYGGKKVEHSILDSIGKLSGKYIFNYNNKGNVKEVRKTDSKENSEWYQIREFYSNGKMSIQNSFDKNDKLMIKTSLKYDRMGDLVEQTNYFPGSNLTTKYFYKYDNHDKFGNWLRQTKYVTNRNDEIIIREIEYY